MKILRLLAAIFLFLIIFRFLARGVFIFALIFGLIMLANKAKQKARRRKKVLFSWEEDKEKQDHRYYRTGQQDPEKTILQLASEHNGTITLADISMHTEISRNKAKKIIDHFSRIGVMENKISDKGVLVYFFPLLPNRKMMIDLSYADHNKIEKSLMKMAAANNNRISLAGIALNTTLDIDRAASFMELLCQKGTSAREIGTSDAVIYYFTEIISEEEKSSAKDIWE